MVVVVLVVRRLVDVGVVVKHGVALLPVLVLRLLVLQVVVHVAYTHFPLTCDERRIFFFISRLLQVTPDLPQVQL